MRSNCSIHLNVFGIPEKREHGSLRRPRTRARRDDYARRLADNRALGFS
jgi:hypothetical protein